MSTQWGDIAALASAGIAVASAGIAAWQAGEARKARKESATWAEESAQASTRSADAAERSLALEEAAARAAEPPEVGWILERANKNRFVLRNIGTKTATGVTVDESQIPAIKRDVPQGATVPGGNGSVSFLMVPSNGAPVPHEIWVTWYGASEPVAVPVPPW